jgi:hypothetical protein
MEGSQISEDRKNAGAAKRRRHVGISDYRRRKAGGQVFQIFNFAGGNVEVRLPVDRVTEHCEIDWSIGKIEI